MGQLGMPELIVILVMGLLFWAVPLAAIVWALVTLQRIRAGQTAIQVQLEMLTSKVRQSPTS